MASGSSAIAHLLLAHACCNVSCHGLLPLSHRRISYHWRDLCASHWHRFISCAVQLKLILPSGGAGSDGRRVAEHPIDTRSLNYILVSLL